MKQSLALPVEALPRPLINVALTSVFTFLLAVNIAREKTTFQSCDGTIRGLLADIDAVSGKAVDNNIDEFPANGFCSQTCASNAWWAVDLNDVEKDIEVVIFSADLCCCK